MRVMFISITQPCLLFNKMQNIKVSVLRILRYTTRNYWVNVRTFCWAQLFLELCTVIIIITEVGVVWTSLSACGTALVSPNSHICLQYIRVVKLKKEEVHNMSFTVHTTMLIKSEVFWESWAVSIGKYWMIQKLRYPQLKYLLMLRCRSQWPRGLRRRSAAARLLRLWVRITSGVWMSVVVSVVCCEVEVSATSWSLVQRSPTDCGAPQGGGGGRKWKWMLRWCFVRCWYHQSVISWLSQLIPWSAVWPICWQYWFL